MKKLLFLTLALFVSAGIVFAFTYDWEIDYMEYANDAAAQAAYVSSDTNKTVDSCAVMTSNTAPSPNVTSADDANSGYEAYKAFDNSEVTTGTAWLAEFAQPHWIKYYFGAGNGKIIKYLRITSRLCGGSGYGLKDFVFAGSNNDADWTTLHTGQQANNGNVQEYNFANNTPYTYFRLTSSNHWHVTYTYTYIANIDMRESNLQSYSESTIKQQGTYSLKGVAVITDSLSDTLTRTIGDNLDFSNCTGIEYDICALRTGSNIKIGIHDSGGTTTEHTANVASSNTNQTESWDISGVSDANKDDIDSIIVTIVNADAANTFYIDDLKEGLDAVTGGYGAGWFIQ